jgi:hypothetical protein
MVGERPADEEPLGEAGYRAISGLPEKHGCNAFGQGALFHDIPADERPFAGCQIAQMDEITHRKSHGWWAFPAGTFQED